MALTDNEKVMEDEEMGTEQKTKKKKKKREHGEEEPLVDIDMKKKKKSKKTDEQEEEGEDSVQDDEVNETTHKQRRRKESCGDSDWSERHEDNAEIIRARAVNKKGSVEEEEEQVTYKKKKKKREENEEKTEDSEESDVHCKVKKKKKKNRDAEEEVEIQSLSDSSTSYPVEEKKKRKKGGENMHSPEEHTFAVPEIREQYVSEDDRERKDKKRKEKRRADKEGRREKADSYSSQRISEEGTQMGDRRNWDEGEARENMPHSQIMVEEQERLRRAEIISHSRRMEAERERLKKIMEEQERLKRTETISHSRKMEAERERLKKRLSGGVSYLAYSGMLGWETDSTVDDQDFSDDLYHQPRRVIQERMKILRNTGENAEHVVYSEGDAISDYVPCVRWVLLSLPVFLALAGVL